jgi:hypothetical protein
MAIARVILFWLALLGTRVALTNGRGDSSVRLVTHGPNP